MYNAELVRSLCHDVTVEKDPVKVHELIELLKAVLKDDQEEVRLRMAFIAKRYSTDMNSPDPTD